MTHEQGNRSSKAHRGEVMADLSLHITGPVVDLLKELEVVKKERDALRVIASDYLAESHLHVKPEDAADVLRWAQNPDAVRYLIAQTPYAIPEHPETEDFQCRGCGEEQGRRPHPPNCPVFAAWAALDDPRAAEAIGAAFDRALAEAQQERESRSFRAVADANRAAILTAFALPGTFRLASESEQAARERIEATQSTSNFAAELSRDFNRAERESVARRDRLRLAVRADQERTRAESDARGMEAVEDEARRHEATGLGRFDAMQTAPQSTQPRRRR